VRWLAVRGQPDPQSDKRWLGVVLDITDQKQAEVQAEQDRMALLHMTRVSMLGQMLASIAHQLNQPLGAILANAQASQQVLTREPVDLVQAKEICDDIVTEVQRAAEVINRLNALFKRRPMQVDHVDVNALVSDTLKLARPSLLAQQIVVKTELTETSLCVDGDRVQLQQVLLNLIMNAADALRSIPVVMRQLLIRTEGFGAAVGVTVTDHGTGIAPEDLPNVFEPFWSSKPSGMGIGLSICRSIVVAHHGTLVATNNPAGGATFSMTLPSHGSA
jgi:C4-dicarboxylate-specific signal transduction histidine kinase